MFLLAYGLANGNKEANIWPYADTNIQLTAH